MCVLSALDWADSIFSDEGTAQLKRIPMNVELAVWAELLQDVGTHSTNARSTVIISHLHPRSGRGWSRAMGAGQWAEGRTGRGSLRPPRAAAAGSGSRACGRRWSSVRSAPSRARGRQRGAGSAAWLLPWGSSAASPSREARRRSVSAAGRAARVGEFKEESRLEFRGWDLFLSE